jgi:hypothetical protein
MRRIPLHLATALGAVLALRTRYSLTLSNDAGTPGCRIKVPAKLVCLESTKSNVSPTPPGGGPTTSSTQGFLCYQMKCQRSGVASAEMQDQFGRRTVAFRGSTLLCAPATRGAITAGPTPAPGATTTTLPVGQCRFADGRCQGQCSGGARCATTASGASCECRSTSCGDASAPECSGFCPTQGEACIFSVTGCSCVRVP